MRVCYNWGEKNVGSVCTVSGGLPMITIPAFCENQRCRCVEKKDAQVKLALYILTSSRTSFILWKKMEALGENVVI